MIPLRDSCHKRLGDPIHEGAVRFRPERAFISGGGSFGPAGELTGGLGFDPSPQLAAGSSATVQVNSKFRWLRAPATNPSFSRLGRVGGLVGRSPEACGFGSRGKSRPRNHNLLAPYAIVSRRGVTRTRPRRGYPLERRGEEDTSTAATVRSGPAPRNDHPLAGPAWCGGSRSFQTRPWPRLAGWVSAADAPQGPMRTRPYGRSRVPGTPWPFCRSARGMPP